MGKGPITKSGNAKGFSGTMIIKSILDTSNEENSIEEPMFKLFIRQICQVD